MNIGTSPLLSIIIPTKNRYETLLPVVKAILLNVKSEDFELIIQDNSDSNNSILSFFTNNEDQRLHYFYESKSLSISENTILAIEKIKGKFAIFIGDDDIVSPYICEIASKLDSVNGDGLIYRPAHYWWKSVEFKEPNFYYKKDALWIPKKISSDFILKNAETELDSVLYEGSIGYYSLPRFYHGIIRTSALTKIKEKIGTYLSGSCPDIAFSTSLSLVIDNYYFVNYPVSVFGASRNSGGGLSASNKHFGKIEDQKFLQKGIIDRWDPNIPLIWSECTIYPQTVYEVLKAFNIAKKTNYISFYAAMLSREAHLNKYTKPLIFNYCGKNLKLYLKLLIIYLKKMGGIYMRIFKLKTKTFGYIVYEVPDMEQVMNTLKKINL